MILKYFCLKKNFLWGKNEKNIFRTIFSSKFLPNPKSTCGTYIYWEINSQILSNSENQLVLTPYKYKFVSGADSDCITLSILGFSINGSDHGGMCDTIGLLHRLAYIWKVYQNIILPAALCLVYEEKL